MKIRRSTQRLQPRLPVGAVKTYAVIAPVRTHWRVVPCERADPECQRHADGWLVLLDPNDQLDRRRLDYIKLHSGRTFRDARTLPFDVLEMLTIPDTHIALYFPPGQQCFDEHRIPLEREPLLVVRGGDWRGNPRREKRVHATRDDWVNDFAEHQQTLADRFNQG